MEIAGEIRKSSQFAEASCRANSRRMSERASERAQRRSAIKSRANADLKLHPVRRHYRIVSPRITAAFLSYLSYRRQECNTGTRHLDTRGGTRTRGNADANARSFPRVPRRRLDVQRIRAIGLERKSRLIHEHSKSLFNTLRVQIRKSSASRLGFQKFLKIYKFLANHIFKNKKSNYFRKFQILKKCDTDTSVWKPFLYKLRYRTIILKPQRY